MLTLNLHGYQEISTEGVDEADLTDELAMSRIAAYGPLLDRLAAGIQSLDPDVVCLQEVGEWPSTRPGQPITFGDSETNIVRQLLSRLPAQPYEYTMDWSHYGWDVWLEGSAILSRYPLVDTDSRVISKSDSKRNWKTRNVPMAAIDAPGVGALRVFSVHTGWWDDPDEPFQQQFRQLARWVDSYEEAATTILCGDFNVPAGSEGYALMTADYLDSYAAARPEGFNDATIDGGAAGWEQSASGRRIDYILLRHGGALEPISARRVFTSEDFGRVSDHIGVYVEFSKKRDNP